MTRYRMYAVAHGGGASPVVVHRAFHGGDAVVQSLGVLLAALLNADDVRHAKRHRMLIDGRFHFGEALGEQVELRKDGKAHHVVPADARVRAHDAALALMSVAARVRNPPIGVVSLRHAVRADHRDGVRVVVQIAEHYEVIGRLRGGYECNKANG